jgi:hypothetical protein
VQNGPANMRVRSTTRIADSGTPNTPPCILRDSRSVASSG